MRRDTRVALLVCVALLLAQPLVAILRTPDRLTTYPSLQVDAAAYDAIARGLASRRTLDAIPPLQPPGFVMLIAAVYTVTGPSWFAARVMLWIAFVACTALTAWLAWTIDGRERAGWAAALLTAASPALQAYSGTIQYEVIAALWLLVLVAAAGRLALRSRSAAAAVAEASVVALLAAAAVLTRESLIAVVPVLALYLGSRVATRFGRRYSAIVAVTVLIVAAAPVAAWAAFQSNRSGRTVPLSDKAPLAMAFGNNPNANGTFNAALAGVAEPSGLAFIRAEPATSVTRAGRKFLYFWGILRDGWNVPRQSALWVARAGGGLVPLDWILPVMRGGWTLALASWPRSRWRDWWHIPAAIAAILSVHLITVSSHRFAVPILPLAFAIIAGPAATSASWVTRSPRGRRVAALALAVVVAMQMIPWRIRYRLDVADLDGIEAVNRVDPARGTVRYAAGAKGARPVLSLGDAFLPHGRFAVTVTYRVASQPAPPAMVAQAWLRTLEGRPLCEMTIQTSPDTAAAWRNQEMDCALERDEIATLAVETTGVADLEFGDVVLTWR